MSSKIILYTDKNLSSDEKLFYDYWINYSMENNFIGKHINNISDLPYLFIKYTNNYDKSVDNKFIIPYIISFINNVAIYHKNFKLNHNNVSKNRFTEKFINFNTGKLILDNNLPIFVKTLPTINFNTGYVTNNNQHYLINDKYFLHNLYKYYYENNEILSSIKPPSYNVKLIISDKFHSTFSEMKFKNKLDNNINYDKSINLLSNICEDKDVDCHQLVMKYFIDDKINNNSYWSKIVTTDDKQKIIDNMHPLLALRILQKFGFKTKQIYDMTSNNKLIKVVSYSKWLKMFAKNKFTPSQIQNIENSGLEKYLQILVDFVNSHPGLLNKNLPENIITDDKIGKFTINIPNVNVRNDNYDLYHDMLRLKSNLINKNEKSFPFSLDKNGLFKSNTGTDLIGKYNELEENNYEFAEKNNLIKNLLLEIKNYKNINNYDIEYINKKLNNMNTIEINIIKTLSVIQEYNKLLKIKKYHEIDQLSKNKMKEMIKIYDELKEKYYNNEIDIVDKLLKLSNNNY